MRVQVLSLAAGLTVTKGERFFAILIDSRAVPESFCSRDRIRSANAGGQGLAILDTVGRLSLV